MRRALRGADVVLLIGARLNWILHFGQPPRFNPNVKIVQVKVTNCGTPPNVCISHLTGVAQVPLHWV